MDKDLSQLLTGFKTRELFAQLYGNDENTIDAQIVRYNTLIQKYYSFFPNDKGDIQLFSTSGRTEVGGNHTDHNAGRVLAAAVSFDTIAAVIKNDSDTITVYSEGFP